MHEQFELTIMSYPDVFYSTVLYCHVLISYQEFTVT